MFGRPTTPPLVRLTLVAALALLGPAVASAQQPAGNPPKDPPPAGAQPAPGQPPAGGNRAEMDFNRVVLPLKNDTFTWHLRDLDDKIGSSSNYWGKVCLVYILPWGSDSDYLAEIKMLKTAMEKHPSAMLICILIGDPVRDSSHTKRAQECIRKHRLPGDRFFLSMNQATGQIANPTLPMPFFIFLGKDGKVSSPTYAWSKKMVERADEILEKLGREPKPQGQAPPPPEMEEVKPPDMYRKVPEQTGPPDAG